MWSHGSCAWVFLGAEELEDGYFPFELGRGGHGGQKEKTATEVALQAVERNLDGVRSTSSKGA